MATHKQNTHIEFQQNKNRTYTMGKRLLIIFVIIQSSILIVTSFDYLKLVEQWPPSTCNNLKINPCSYPLPNNFTIHGLWPEFFQATKPPSCPSTPFDLSKIKALEPQLNQHWPNLNAPTQNSVFWEHEWSKHGTCSTLDQTAYFVLTLNLMGRLNILKVLQDAKITPGGTYPAIEIFNAIKKKTQFDPHLRCNSPFKTQTSQLWEVGVCYDIQGAKHMNCLPPFGKPTSICNNNTHFPVS